MMPGEPASCIDPDPAGLAGGELHDAARTTPDRDPERCELPHHRAHPQLAVEEDDVDREAHEEGVDRRGARNEEALPGSQAGAAEQAARASPEARGDLAAFADDSALLVGKPVDLGCAPSRQATAGGMR